MRSMSIGIEPIAVTSLYPAPQTVSEGSFAQSLQDTVDVGVTTTVSEQPVNNGELQQTTEPAQPQQTAQEAPQASQETPQTAQEPQQAAEAAQPQQTVHNPEAEQTREENIPAEALKPTEAAQPDPDLMKELADLLKDTEKLMTAPQRMQEKLKDLIAQAFEELSDPEVKEDEFTEKVLEFLLKFIDRAFGGEKQETSVFSDTDEEETDVQDVLLQAVVQMLENIRSDNAETAAPEESEQDQEAVAGIPSTHMAKEYVKASANELLGEEARQTVELEAVDDAAAVQQNDAVPQTETDREAPLQTAAPAVSADGQTAVKLPGKEQVAEAAQPVETAKPAEAVQTVEAEKPAETAEPVEEANENALYQAAAQAAESIYTAVTQPQKPVAGQAQPVRADRSREGGEAGGAQRVQSVQTIRPAEELEELTRLVRTGDSARAEQSGLTDHGEKTEQLKLGAELPKIGETASFETVIVTAESQPVLTRSFGHEGSGAQQIVTQIVSEIFNQLPENSGTTTFVMTLNPESLGKVTVKLVEEAGKISVSVTAHEKHTAEILSQRFDSLQAAMKDNGTQLEKYQVVYEPEQSEGSGQQSFDGSSKNPYVKQDDEESEGDGAFAELLQQAV